MIYTRVVNWRKERRLMREAAELIQTQQLLLQRASRQIREWQDLTLHTTRHCHDLAVAMRIAQEAPEIDLRDDLDALIFDLGNQVAQLEEHIC